MDEFQEKIYHFILDLFESTKTRNRVVEMINKVEGYFQEKSSTMYHQVYPGGNADHTFLATLDMYHSAITKPWAKIEPDDILVVGLSHDIDKIGKYTDAIPREVKSDRGIVYFIEKYFLRSKETQDGIIMAHGGWSHYKGEHSPIGIYTHAGDMLASHATRDKDPKKDKELTRMRTLEIIEEIHKLTGKGLK
jgi:hypothetical protein